ncbi:MAG: glutathione binding-like protein, partial [Patescibacteria group bacterium]
SQLGTRSYLAGDQFTIADINGVSTFAYARWAEYDLSSYPNISAWIARCEERPAYKAAKGE